MLPISSSRHCASSAPSSRTLPRNAGQMPVIARTSVVLPPALGPMMPSDWPALSWKSTSVAGHLAGARNGHGHLVDAESRARRRQLHGLFGAGERDDRVPQPLIGHARRNEGLPVADRKIDRRQRSRRGDGAAMMAPAESSPLMVR